MTTDRQNRRLTLIAVMSAFTAVVVVTLVVLGLPPVLAAASNTKAINRSQDITSCRAVANTDVTNKQAAFLIAVGDAVDAGQNNPAGRAEIDSATAALRQAVKTYTAKVVESQSNPDQFVQNCHK